MAVWQGEFYIVTNRAQEYCFFDAKESSINKREAVNKPKKIVCLISNGNKIELIDI